MRKVAGEHPFCVLIYMNSYIIHICFGNCVWNSLVFSYLASMSGVVCVVCHFADEKLKNIHGDLALLV